MIRKIILIIGIVIFILVISATYILEGVTKSDNKYSDDVTKKEIGEIVYKGKLAMPIENFIEVTSKYGYRESVYNSEGIQISGGTTHTGIDLCGSLGSKVMAVADGEVTFSGWQNGYGNCIEIRHKDEQGKEFYSFYGHMRNQSLQVSKGQQVVTGQIIGTQGSTGNSTR